MTIIRGARQADHYLIVRNDVARDTRLSYRARGLLVAILSRPDDWRTSSSELAREATEGREAVRTALRELETLGYIVRRKYQSAETGRWQHDLVVFDSPQPSAQESDDGYPGDGEPGVGSPGVGNLGGIQTTETNHRDKEPNLVARRLAELLADLIEANGATRPAVTDEWVACIDRMIRLDRRTPSQIENAIRWAQGDEFWRANILSPRKLREQYERLRLNAMRQRQQANAATGVDAALAVLAEVSQDHRRQA